MTYIYQCFKVFFKKSRTIIQCFLNFKKIIHVSLMQNIFFIIISIFLFISTRTINPATQQKIQEIQHSQSGQAPKIVIIVTLINVRRNPTYIISYFWRQEIHTAHQETSKQIPHRPCHQNYTRSYTGHALRQLRNVELKLCNSI